MRKFSTGINGLRGICSLIIILFHFELYYKFGSHDLFSSGYIAVEFFFVLSGFLVYKSYKEKNKKEVSKAVIDKITKMYPAYLFALLMLISVYVLKWYGLNYIKWFKTEPNNINFISELLLVQSTGVSKFDYVNGPAWYVSSLIVNTGIIVALLNVFKKYSKYILGLITVSIYTYYFLNNFSMSTDYFLFGVLSSALLRGIAGMSLGCLLYMITDKFGSYTKKINLKTYNVIQLLVFFFFLLLMIYRTPSRLNFLIFIPSTLLIYLLFSREGILDKIFTLKPLKFLGDISFEIYVFQFPCSNIINCWFSNLKQPYVTILYLAINLIVAVCFYYSYNYIVKLRSKKNEV